MAEIWAKIPGVRNEMMVSNLGRVKSLLTGNYFKGSRTEEGYLRVDLVRLDGTGYTVAVHVAAMLAFVGEPPTAIHQVNHINGVHWDNRLENLEYVTGAQNTIHSYKLGRVSGVKGDNHPRMKIPEAELMNVVRRHLSGETLESIARAYKVSTIPIRNIIHGRRRFNDPTSEYATYAAKMLEG